MPAINFTGLASGLDTKALIDAILKAEREPIERLQTRVQVFNSKRAAYDELSAKLLAFESALRSLASDRAFRGRTTSVSDTAFLKAAAAPGAEAGLFEVEVVSLAAAHKVRSGGFAASDESVLSDGTLTIQSGDNDPITIEVSATRGNNTLAAVRDEINASDQGVRASVIFDGTEYLLTVRAEKSGTNNALDISDGIGLGLDTISPVTAAADAKVIVDGVEIVSSSNKITGVISGVTLDLLSTHEPGETVTVEVAQDIDGVVAAVEKVVAGYNDLAGFLDGQDNRDNPGPLAGDTVLRTVESRVQSLFTGGLAGIPLGGIRSLSSVGVGFDGKTGEATLDTSKLRELLETRFDEVGDLFLSSGRANDPRVQFLSGGLAADSGEYALQITQAAERATVVGGVALTSTLRRDETLTLTVGADQVAVDLLQGDDLATVIDRINTAFDAAGIQAFAANDANFLRISTSDYGSAVELTVVSSRVAGVRTSGIGSFGLTDTGQDVAGTLGGLAAVGSGRVLGGADGTAVAGLNVKVTATTEDIAAVSGAFGTVSFSRGLVDTLLSKVRLFSRFGGTLDSARDSQDRNVERINDDIARIEERLLAREARLLRTFSAAERAISLLQGQQSSLGSVTLL